MFEALMLRRAIRRRATRCLMFADAAMLPFYALTLFLREGAPLCLRCRYDMLPLRYMLISSCRRRRRHAMLFRRCRCHAFSCQATQVYTLMKGRYGLRRYMPFRADADDA